MHTRRLLVTLVLLLVIATGYWTAADAPAPAVYITRTGSRYHRETCWHARNGLAVSVQAALCAGYTPCRVCRPPKRAFP